MGLLVVIFLTSYITLCINLLKEVLNALRYNKSEVTFVIKKLKVFTIKVASDLL